MTTQTTLQLELILELPFDWCGGTIFALTQEEIKEVAEEKHKEICVLCGQKKPLLYERFSGGLRSYICEECAMNYVQAASKVMKKYGDDKE